MVSIGNNNVITFDNEADGRCMLREGVSISWPIRGKILRNAQGTMKIIVDIVCVPVDEIPEGLDTNLWVEGGVLHWGYQRFIELRRPCPVDRFLPYFGIQREGPCSKSGTFSLAEGSMLPHVSDGGIALRDHLKKFRTLTPWGQSFWSAQMETIVAKLVPELIGTPPPAQCCKGGKKYVPWDKKEFPSVEKGLEGPRPWKTWSDKKFGPPKTPRIPPKFPRGGPWF